MNSPNFIGLVSTLKKPKIAKSKISHRNLNKARTYLFLTLGSAFFFACVYYIVQKIKPDKESTQKGAIQTKAYGDQVSEKTQTPDVRDTDNNNPTQSLSHWSAEFTSSERLNVPDGELPFFGCLLFSLVTQTTVGYAWFVPTDNLTRLVVFFQILSIVCIAAITLFT